jgi:hypothetical protein
MEEPSIGAFASDSPGLAASEVEMGAGSEYEGVTIWR